MPDAAKDITQIDNPAKDILPQIPYRVLTKKQLPVIAYMLIKGLSQAQMARLFNKSPQAVNQFIYKYKAELQVLLDCQDEMLALKYKALSDKLINSIDDASIKKESVRDRIVGAGITTDKYRDLQGKTTPNIVILGADLSGFLLKKVEGNPDKNPENEADIINITPLPETEK